MYYVYVNYWRSVFEKICIASVQCFLVGDRLTTTTLIGRPKISVGNIVNVKMQHVKGVCKFWLNTVLKDTECEQHCVCVCVY